MNDDQWLALMNETASGGTARAIQIVRKDERAKVLAEMRVKVKVARDEAGRRAFDFGGDHWFGGAEEAYQTVLALIDRSV